MGGEKDLIQSYMWPLVAHRKGGDGQQEALDGIKKEMGKEEVAKTEVMAEEWIWAHYK